MNTTKIRLALAAVAAVAALSATGVSDVASAAVPVSRAIPTQTQTGHPQAIQRTTTGAGTRPVAPTASTAMGIQAGATGDGPADQKECDKYADAINSWVDQAVTDKNDVNQAMKDLATSDQLVNEALDQGCFIVE